MELTKAKIAAYFSQQERPYCELLLILVFVKARINPCKSIMYGCLDSFPYLRIRKYYSEILSNMKVFLYFCIDSTHHAIVPLQAGTASQGASFAFKKSYNTPAMPLLLSTLSGFFRAYV